MERKPSDKRSLTTFRPAGETAVGPLLGGPTQDGSVNPPARLNNLDLAEQVAQD